MTDALDLYRFAKAHSFEAAVDDDNSISVFIPWSQRQPDGTLATGTEEVSGIETMEHLREVLGY